MMEHLAMGAGPVFQQDDFAAPFSERQKQRQEQGTHNQPIGKYDFNTAPAMARMTNPRATTITSTMNTFLRMRL